MKMAIRVDKFLGVFKLEIGGQLIGWLYLIIGLTLLVIMGGLFGDNLRYGFPTEFLVGIFAASFIIYAAKELIDGSRMRRSYKIKPAIALSLCACVFPTILMIFVAPSFGFLIIILSYLIISLYSLFRVFEEEEKAASHQTVNSSVQQMIDTVSEVPEPANATGNQTAFDYSSNLVPSAPPRYKA